jgi:prepilin-type N-terminal cleavage/methylation domain-containing protein
MNARTTQVPPASGRRSGFTLLELLVVITMMIFITTIAVMNYLGVMRGAGWTTLSSNIRNTLLMARQRACLDNKPVVFYLLDKTNYVVQIAHGTVAKIDHGTPQTFWDQEAVLGDTNAPLLNLDRPGATATISGTAPGNLSLSNVNASGVMQTYHVAALRYTVVTNGYWAEGDRYGIQAFTPLTLPKGFEFTPDPLSVSAGQRMVLFQPDGTIDTAGGLSSLVVRETLSGKTALFTMDPSGSISQGP